MNVFVQVSQLCILMPCHKGTFALLCKRNICNCCQMKLLRFLRERIQSTSRTRKLFTHTLSFHMFCWLHCSFPKWNIQSRNLINNWNMDPGYFKDLLSYLCLPGSVVVFQLLTQEVPGSSDHCDQWSFQFLIVLSLNLLNSVKVFRENSNVPV